jgi:hypothetical protein
MKIVSMGRLYPQTGQTDQQTDELKQASAEETAGAIDRVSTVLPSLRTRGGGNNLLVNQAGGYELHQTDSSCRINPKEPSALNARARSFRISTILITKYS